MKLFRALKLPVALLAVLTHLQMLAAFGGEPGVTDVEIRIGSSGAMTGPIGKYGTEMAAGAEAFYKRLNASGGVNGRKIVFVPKDDGYEPRQTAENLKQLTEGAGVFALVGGNGTPNIKAILPSLNAQHLPLLFPYTGGINGEKNVYNLRISYADEAAALINHAVKTLKLTRVGVLFQNDAFGTAGKSGVAKALSAFDMTLQGEGSYLRNTEDVDKAVTDLMQAGPQAVYLQAVQKPALAFMKQAAERGFHPLYLSSSVVGALDMISGLGSKADNIVVSEVFPLPTETSYAVVRSFQADMKAAGKGTMLTSVALEGYTGAYVFAEILKRIGKEVTRQRLVSALESLQDENIGGLRLSLSPERHNALGHGFLVRLKDGKALPIQ